MPKETKQCIECGDEKEIKDFTKSNHKRLNTCKKCNAAYSLRRYNERKVGNPLLHRAVLNGLKKAHHMRVAIVLDYYGGKCECCGETEPKFLTIDHIKDIGGTKKRGEAGHYAIYKFLVDHRFPAGFRLLCSNCNFGRARNGGICPHQMGSQAISQESSGKRREVPEVLPKQDQDMVETLKKFRDAPFMGLVQ